MASASISTNYREALDSLAWTIAKDHLTGDPHETARELLEIDNPGHAHLVGINYDASKAVYYHCKDRYTIAVRFDSDGLADGGPRIGTFQNQSLREWIERWEAYWGWLHPRYR